MNFKYKIFTVLLMLFAFTSQTVLACACEIETIVASDHDHHPITMDVHDTGHECESNCHLASLDVEGQAFITYLDSKVKLDKKNKTLSLSQTAIKIIGHHSAPIKIISRQNILNLVRKNTLLQQKTLLLI